MKVGEKLNLGLLRRRLKNLCNAITQKWISILFKLGTHIKGGQKKSPILK